MAAMRKYTRELLVAFKKLCDKPEARIAKARKALGIAIIYEATIGTENLRKTVNSPWMGDVQAALDEMKDEGWVEAKSPPEDPGDYLEFKDAISKFYGRYTTRPKEILKSRHPFGDHWFYLTSWGEEKASEWLSQASTLKAFLSYSTPDKELAGKIKQGLEDYGIEVFLAHEDIEPLADWIETIKAELEASQVFLLILTHDFYKSAWTDQETGIAFARNKVIIPLKVSVDPRGFVSKLQALPVRLNNVQSSCRKIVKTIAATGKVADLFRNTLIRKFGNSMNYAEARHNTDLLLLFRDYTLAQAISILRKTVVNSQVYGCFQARKELPRFIDQHRNGIDSALLKEFDKAMR